MRLGRGDRYRDLAELIDAGTVPMTRSWLAILIVFLLLVLIPYAFELDRRYEVKDSMSRMQL